MKEKHQIPVEPGKLRESWRWAANALPLLLALCVVGGLVYILIEGATLWP